MTKAERAEFKQLMTEVFEAKLEPYLNAINTDLLHQARRISYSVISKSDRRNKKAVSRAWTRSWPNCSALTLNKSS